MNPARIDGEIAGEIIATPTRVRGTGSEAGQ